MDPMSLLGGAAGAANPLSLAAGGAMALGGGTSSAKNGDQVFDGRAEFGGLNYKTGLNPWFVVGGAVVVGVVALWVVKRA